MGMEYSETGVTNKEVAVTFKCQGRNWFDEDQEQAAACVRILDTIGIMSPRSPRKLLFRKHP